MNEKAIQEFAQRVWQYKQGELVSLMIHLGDRMGLYRAMSGAGHLTPGDLAESVSLSERWVAEWLYGQAAAGLLAHEGGQFALSDEGAAVLAAEGASPFFSAGAFAPADRISDAERISAAFAEHGGFSYDELGVASMEQTERTTGPQIEFMLVRFVLSQVERIVDRLSEGGRGVDVGCGAGVATRVLARSFPESHFTGVDSSEIAIARAREFDIENADFQAVGAEFLPAEPTFDLALAFDCLHDMPRPDLVLAAIRRSLVDDGVLVIKDVKSSGTFEEDLRNPMLAMLYGFSVSACLGSGLSTDDGLGLGTLGFHPDVAERLCREAGFTRFRILEVPDPANLYYEARP